MSSGLLTRVARPAQYTSSRSVGSSVAVAEQYVSTSPVPTLSPAPRSSRAKPTSTSVNGTRSSTRRDLLQAVPDQVEIVAVLDDRAERVVRSLWCQLRLPQESQGADPVDGLCDSWRLRQVELAQPVHGAHNFPGELLGDAGLADEDDLHLPLLARVADPVVQAATPQGVMQFPGPVGGQDDSRCAIRLYRADLGDADLEVGEDFQQECLELVIGTVNLVDEQHGLVTSPDRLEQRPFQQELRAEQPVHGLLVGHLMLRQGSNLQHLPCIVPFVQGLVGVDTLVALQPDQPSPEDAGQDFSDLGLSDANLALQEQRATERQRDHQRGSQSAVREVGTLAQVLRQLADGRRVLH